MGLICAPYPTLVRQDAPNASTTCAECSTPSGECVDRGCTGEEASADAEAKGIRLEVVKHPAAKKGLYSCRAGGG